MIIVPWLKRNKRGSPRHFSNCLERNNKQHQVCAGLDCKKQATYMIWRERECDTVFTTILNVNFEMKVCLFCSQVINLLRLSIEVALLN